MNDQERPSLGDYQELLLQSTENRLFKSRGFYDTYLNGLVAELKNSIFSTLVSHLGHAKSEYASPDYLFLTDPEGATLSFKPLESIYNKIYRQNVLRPRRWPSENQKNDISLDNFHITLDDIFRTRLICRYLDGPKFACERLAEKCAELGVEYFYRAVTTDLGYHAWHFYYEQPIEDFAGTGPADVKVELQFTTQLAEVIGSLTHVQYESRRLGEKFDDDWRWNVNSKQFRPYYIAHGLHLLEGVILEFRDTVQASMRADEEGQEKKDSKA